MNLTKVVRKRGSHLKIVLFWVSAVGPEIGATSVRTVAVGCRFVNTSISLHHQLASLAAASNSPKLLSCAEVSGFDGPSPRTVDAVRSARNIKRASNSACFSGVAANGTEVLIINFLCALILHHMANGRTESPEKARCSGPIQASLREMTWCPAGRGPLGSRSLAS